MARALLVASVMALGGCTAVILEGFPPAECASAADCADLNDQGVVPDGRTGDACHAWRCGAGGTCVYALLDADEDGAIAAECEEAARRELDFPRLDCDDADPRTNGLDEVCDGLDNDCDGLVDEGVAPEEAPRSMVAGVRASALEYVSTAEGIGLAWNRVQEGAFAAPGEPERRELTYESTPVADMDDASSLALVEGCHSSGSTDVAGGCNEESLSVSEGGGARFVAAVSGEGCASVRVGILNEASIRLRGPLRRSSSYLGLHLDPASPDCVLGEAAHVRVTADGGDRALVTWLDAARTLDRCDLGPYEIRAAVVHRLEHALGEPYEWLTASGEGVADRLGATRGYGRVASVAYGDGWITAHADETGDVALSRVVAPAPPPNPMTTGAGPAAPASVRDAEIRVPPLGGIEGATIDATRADLTAIALAGVDDGVARLGVAWREAICDGPARLLFAEVGLVLADASFESTPDPIEIDVATPGEELGPPSIARLESGVGVPGRGDTTSEGGWIVAYGAGPRARDGVRPRDHARVARIADGGIVLDPAPARLVEMLPGPRFIAVHASGEGPTLHWLQADEVVYEDALSCPPPE